jgi:hypothetical protein
VFCKGHIETSKELFDEKTVSFRLTTVPRYFLYVWEKLSQLNTFCHFNNLFTKACPESKDTKVLNMYNVFNLQKRHCE